MQPAPLTKEAWLDAALDALRTEGYGALKALPLAKKLNVTRGSFYHHFDSLDAFETAVIAHWAKRSSGALIQLTLAEPDSAEALGHLLQQTLRSGSQMERAVRSWATVKPRVAVEVEKIDDVRIDTAEQLLLRCHVPASAAQPRAKVLYWAAIGRMMLPFPEHNMLSKTEIDALAALMLQP